MRGCGRPDLLVLEALAGCARLTHALADLGIGTDNPLEAYPKPGVYVASHDLSRSEVVRLLERTRGYFSIENPRTSHVWRYDPISQLNEIAFDVDFDQ
eukprot:2523593-Heterocapsa_arctica.AAC.1